MSAEKRKILVVDDDPELLQLVRILLARAGFETLTALDVPSARTVLSSGTLPDVMVLDIMLPGVSGIEFLEEIRAIADFDSLPILMLSALADQQQIRAALDRGADRYLTKPYVASSLVSIVQEILSTKRR
ncbi:MAG: response regulator [Anaerolineae bacterium]|nr:response regulator [Anaerolineae bacterium]NUQ03553.1 response regulator [Anaerolineae bacterium]